MTFADGFSIRSTTSANFNAVANGIDGALTCHWGGTTGGSANAYTLTPAPAWTATTRLEIRHVFFTPHATNTGATTVNISGLGPVAARYKNQALVGGELVANVEAVGVYDGTVLELLTHGGGWATWSPNYGTEDGANWTSVTANRAIYQRHGSRVDFAIAASGTTVTTDPNELQFALPIAASGGFVSGGGTISNGALITGAGWYIITLTVATVFRADYANLGLGAGRSINVQGFYFV